MPPTESKRRGAGGGRPQDKKPQRAARGLETDSWEIQVTPLQARLQHRYDTLHQEGKFGNLEHVLEWKTQFASQASLHEWESYEMQLEAQPGIRRKCAEGMVGATRKERYGGVGEGEGQEMQ